MVLTWMVVLSKQVRVKIQDMQIMSWSTQSNLLKLLLKRSMQLLKWNSFFPSFHNKEQDRRLVIMKCNPTYVSNAANMTENSSCLLCLSRSFSFSGFSVCLVLYQVPDCACIYIVLDIAVIPWLDLISFSEYDYFPGIPYVKWARGINPNWGLMKPLTDRLLSRRLSTCLIDHQQIFARSCLRLVEKCFVWNWWDRFFPQLVRKDHKYSFRL